MQVIAGSTQPPEKIRICFLSPSSFSAGLPPASVNGALFFQSECPFRGPFRLPVRRVILPCHPKLPPFPPPLNFPNCRRRWGRFPTSDLRRVPTHAALPPYPFPQLSLQETQMFASNGVTFLAIPSLQAGSLLQSRFPLLFRVYRLLSRRVCLFKWR